METRCVIVCEDPALKIKSNGDLVASSDLVLPEQSVTRFEEPGREDDAWKMLHSLFSGTGAAAEMPPGWFSDFGLCGTGLPYLSGRDRKRSHEDSIGGAKKFYLRQDLWKRRAESLVLPRRTPDTVYSVVRSIGL